MSVEDFILMQTPPEIRPIEKRTLRSYVSQKHLRELLLTEPTKSIWNLDMIQDFDQSPSKVEVRTLSNGEKGLFAAQFIPKYALVAEFVGAIIYTDQLDKTSEAYAFTSILGKTSDTFCISPRRDFPETQSGFMANDGFPNVINETFGIRKFYMAIRNIQIGEEIQANYGHFHPVKSLPHYTLSLENIDACQTYLDTVKGISGLIQIIKPLLENPHHDIKQFIIAMECFYSILDTPPLFERYAKPSRVEITAFFLDHFKAFVRLGNLDILVSRMARISNSYVPNSMSDF